MKSYMQFDICYFYDTKRWFYNNIEKRHIKSKSKHTNQGEVDNDSQIVLSSKTEEEGGKELDRKQYRIGVRYKKCQRIRVKKKYT